MHSVFVAGSRAVSRLNKQVKERLDNIARRNFTVLVGDANGADKAAQQYLAERAYRHVFVYCMEICRNNLGDWPLRPSMGERGAKHDRRYYGIKDAAMARDATWGFMIWDGCSKGTLSNVINLVGANKKVLLYNSPQKRFFTLLTTQDLMALVRSAGIKDLDDFISPKRRTSASSERFDFALGRP
jgi:hypothetical protein